MKTITLSANWNPQKDYKLGNKDIEKQLTYLGSKVWHNPKVEIIEKEKPDIDPKSSEVLIEVKACGICGSDVHMAQADENGYICYPGLTAFPVTLGHEFSGVIVKAGEYAIDRRQNKRFEIGEPVCAEEMLWCGICKPCVDGYPNHCEALHETGFTVDGGFAKYIKLHSKYCWSLAPLKRVYNEDKLFLAGSLVEPTSVAYNAVIEIGKGIRPGDNVVIMGGGPIGLAAVSILRRTGAANIILTETSNKRAELGYRMGATRVINPNEVDSVAESILHITEGVGAKLFLEATGSPNMVWGEIEKIIWEGRQLNSTVVIVARSDIKIPVTPEVFQVRRASIHGAQGHSGHGTFNLVINSMASGMDITPIITKTINLDEVPEYLKLLQTDRENAKVTVTNFPEFDS